MGTQALGRQELLIGEDASVVRGDVVGGNGIVVFVAVLGGQHTVLGHGPLNSSGTLAGRLLLLLLLLGLLLLAALGLLVHLDHVQGKSSLCR